ncbi:MAG: YihA family ribosome biogenesis GTP-binding protein [Bacteroidales bacterium]|nr:YihA family ribosome biogenesis GTP-binding protein [Bacteroidales bacterium]
MDYQIKKIKFVKSEADWRKCPSEPYPEVAFIGRSNVGKSSLINMLANNKSLAKTSSKPGKTQTINHFMVDDSWFLVDLPGYGYASISKTMREKWEKMIDNYLKFRENLQTVFVLVDIRLEPQAIDIEFINKLGEMGMPFSLIFTKADKIGKNKGAVSVRNFCRKLMETWEDLPPFFVCSSVDGRGKNEVLDYIQQINEFYYNQKNQERE